MKHGVAGAAQEAGSQHQGQLTRVEPWLGTPLACACKHATRGSIGRNSGGPETHTTPVWLTITVATREKQESDYTVISPESVFSRKCDQLRLIEIRNAKLSLN